VNDLKISLITVVFNAKNTIRDCIESVISQQCECLEYIVIDGGSTDGTLEVIDRYLDEIQIFISKPDRGIYDAMNKGIQLATGNVIGTLNADDCFADCDVLNAVAHAFETKNCDILYGNLNFINLKGEVVRKWHAGKYQHGVYNWGWMAPHPTFYCKRELFVAWGLYSLEYGTAADYELMSRFMHKHRPSVYYIDRLMVTMLAGGVSNKSLISYVKVLAPNLKAMKTNGIVFPFVALLLKPFRKIIQFI
jgi:glycosyltransferase involved in cell wall biosynthesis